MPSQLPLGSFASAAAGQASNRDPRAGVRGETRGAGDWSSRRENRGTNGTVTLRRTSVTPHGAPASQSSSLSDTSSRPDPTTAQTPQTQIPEAPNGPRYTRQEMFDIYRNLQQSDALNSENLSILLNSGLGEPSSALNGHSSRGWGKTGDTARDHNHALDICYDQAGHSELLNMEEPRGLEKTMFATDVNAPAKQAPQNTNGKDHTTVTTANGRRLSISNTQGGVGSFGLASTSASRPGARRRETGDSPFGAIASPGIGSRFGRDDSSPFFSRRAADKDNTQDDRSDDTPSKNNSSFSTLLRSNTGGSTLGNGTSSTWMSPSPTGAFAPMGAFGSFALGGSTGSPTTSTEKRPGIGGLRGESRFAQLMSRDSPEDATKTNDSSSKLQERSWRPQQPVDSDQLSDEANQTGSAALGGSLEDDVNVETRHSHDIQEYSAEEPSQRRHEESRRAGDSHPEFGHTSNSSGDGGAPQGREHGFGDLPGSGSGLFGSVSRAFPNPTLDTIDRSQTNSVNGSRGFPSLGGLGSLTGLGGLGGWPTSAQAAGTPDRERNGFHGAFGNSLFSAGGDLPSPSLAGHGNVFSSGGTIGRSSKLASIFPAAMQAQMQHADNDHNNDTSDARQSGGFGAIGRNTFPRDVNSPMRSGRGVFDDMLPSSSSRKIEGHAPFSQHRDMSSNFAQSPLATPNHPPAPQVTDSAPAPSQPPPREMAMPDCMRWEYLDPSGQKQGPWSGLEMHEWYKASFFTADLSVKKLEDPEFEPLGQLIRRIGNSREPFLVPQVGVNYGKPQADGAPVTSTNATSQGGSVQPPFAGAFPSFGTTLTAEQQNNLERRKQEEQYLMARQREHLAQEQVKMKQQQAQLQMQLQMQNAIPSALHHHPSTHSLQSQPSYGNITSPIGMPQGQLPGVASFFDTSRQGPPTAGISNMPDYFREDDINRLNIHDRQSAFGSLGQQMQGQQLPSVFAPHQDMQRDARMGQVRQQEPANPRLREFEILRAQHDLEQEHMPTHPIAAPIGPPQRRQPEPSFQEPRPTTQDAAYPTAQEFQNAAPQTLSLTEQVQKAASAKQSPAVQAESAWTKVNTGVPMPFPPPRETNTPLPAPTAQRGRSDLAETLNMGTRSRSESLENVTTPSVAPWAKEPTEASKGPSLREIQEAEAKKAAKLEEAALAARRAAAELELRNQPAVVLPAPGLPTSSTWAASGSPAPSAVAGAAWAKAVPAKTTTPLASTAASKKTLADIQKEEESRKAKLAAAAAAALPPGQAVGGKRYADLASKPNVQPAAMSGGAWSTVGASGKVKGGASVTATSQAQVTARSVSTTTVPAIASKVTKPTMTATRTVSSIGTSNVNAANAEFMKWAHLSLDGKLNDGINVKDFASMIAEFPAEIIADSVYANSKTMDGRRFAEEFIRRKKLADKGIIETAGAGASGTASNASGGWSDVAKKNPVKEETATPAGFKVVPTKKKGRK